MGENKAKRDEKAANGEMPLSGHLRELRNRLLVCLGVLLAAAVLGLHYAEELVGVLLALGERYNYHFVYISPQELLIEYFTVSLVFAFCVTLPVILYQIWAFVSPGLTNKERLLFILAMVFGLIFAVIGIIFAYKILLPFMLYFLIALSDGSGVQASVSVQNYISFLMTIFIIFAIIFELPVASVILTQTGILKVEWMKKFRSVVIVVIFFVAAVITPPDVFSQIMVALPMLALYEFSILICSLLAKRKPVAAEVEEGE